MSSSSGTRNKKARPDEAWHRILRMFAQTGLWSKEYGNKPSTTNTHWHSAIKAVILFIGSKNLI